MDKPLSHFLELGSKICRLGPCMDLLEYYDSLLGLFYQGRVGHLDNESDHSLDAFQRWPWHWKFHQGRHFVTFRCNSLELKTMQTGGDDTAVFRPNNFMSTLVIYCVDSLLEMLSTRLPCTLKSATHYFNE